MLYILILILPFLGHSADFDLAFSYGQSRDFWQTVQDVQNKTGDIGEIQNTVRNRYGKPDILYSYLDAAYSYPHEHFDSRLLGQVVFGTRAEALAGGEISNPVSPEIQAYANSLGIFSMGFRSLPGTENDLYVDSRILLGLGSEKKLFAQGAEFLDAIPVRSGTLLLGGLETRILSQDAIGDDFWITTDGLVRAGYFHSTTPVSKSFPKDPSFLTVRWKIQNDWLKETETFLSSRTRFGIISVTGQNPLPFYFLPVSWDYQQRLEFFPGLTSIGGIGGIIRFLSSGSRPNLAFYGGIFGGGIGGGLDLQIGSMVLNIASYGIENRLTPAREKTRLWTASIGVGL